MSSRIFQELEKFQLLPKQAGERGFRVTLLDEYGFSVQASDEPEKSKIDLLITGLIHGDEVIGVEVMNLVFEQLITKKTRLPVHVAFLLGNVDAAKVGLRFIESDLNRSFMVESVQTQEHLRALQVASIVRNASFVFDLHQTVEPTDSPFFVFEHKMEIIRLARQLLPEIPIVTFPSIGFSQCGKTMLEYASSVNIPALAMECGKSGFSSEMSEGIARTIFNLMGRLSDPPANEAFEESVEIHHLCESIPSTGKTHLVAGLTNYMPIHRGQLLGFEAEKPLLAPFDGRLFFPRYGDLARRSPELCDLGRKMLISV